MRISIITIVFNGKDEIEKTIQSVINQSFNDCEYIIIDGESSDGTLDVIKKHSSKISKIVSEKDNGIYDAMNKGISYANGEWLCFMNAGDTFADDFVLERIFNMQIDGDTKFIYSDFILQKTSGEECVIRTDKHKGLILHQASIYRKSLHLSFGLYVVTDSIIISDYMFFSSIPEKYFKKVDVIIARFLDGGVSAAKWCYYHRLCLDVIYKKRKMKELFMLVIYRELIGLIPVNFRRKIKKLLKI